jgi:hypothetical protein
MSGNPEPARSVPGVMRPVIRKDQYQAMKGAIPPEHRGYLYMLRGGCEHEGSRYDIDIGYEVAGPASGISQGHFDLDARVCEFISIDHGVRVVPFYMGEDINPDATVELEALYEQTAGHAASEDTQLRQFLLMMRNLGFFFKRTIVDRLPAYENSPVRVVDGLSSAEIWKIKRAEEHLKRMGLNP